jgi:Zn ribbon nucleic-acid-binding protein
MFRDSETAQSYMENRLWPDGPRCPTCGTGDRIATIWFENHTPFVVNKVMENGI